MPRAERSTQHRSMPRVAATLREAASAASRLDGPLRAWRRRADVLQEVFFYRDLVIHAEAGPLLGVGAVEEMLGFDVIPYHLETGRWPPRQSMQIGWTTIIEAARQIQRERSGPREAAQPVSYVDDSESTAPISFRRHSKG